MITFTDLATGQVIGVVDGRDCAAVKTWLRGRPRWWWHRVRVGAIDPSAAFRSAVRNWLPTARVSVNHFHLIRLANDVLTQVRQRVSCDRHDRSGRRTDLARAHRLLRGYVTPWPRAWPEIETFITTRVTNAKPEAANVTVKDNKRDGRGYRSHANYKCRIMLYKAARMAA